MNYFVSSCTQAVPPTYSTFDIEHATVNLNNVYHFQGNRRIFMRARPWTHRQTNWIHKTLFSFIGSVYDFHCSWNFSTKLKKVNYNLNDLKICLKILNYTTKINTSFFLKTFIKTNDNNLCIFHFHHRTIYPTWTYLLHIMTLHVPPTNLTFLEDGILRLTLLLITAFDVMMSK